MSVTTTSGLCSRRRREEGRRVLGDAHDLDVVVGVQQRPDALANQDVVLAEHHPDRHATAPQTSQFRVYHPRMPLRVVFAEDNYLVREGTAALLATADEVEIVGIGGQPRRAALRGRRARTRRRPHGHPDAAERDRRGNPGREADPGVASRDRRRRAVAVR